MIAFHDVRNAQIENNFTYHAQKENQIKIYEGIRDKAKEYAHFLNDNIIDSREKALALTKLEECVFWANAAIARNENKEGK